MGENFYALFCYPSLHNIRFAHSIGEGEKIVITED
jgi:hypothetical protein